MQVRHAGAVTSVQFRDRFAFEEQQYAFVTIVAITKNTIASQKCFWERIFWTMCSGKFDINLIRILFFCMFEKMTEKRDAMPWPSFEPRTSYILLMGPEIETWNCSNSIAFRGEDIMTWPGFELRTSCILPMGPEIGTWNCSSSIAFIRFMPWYRSVFRLCYICLFWQSLIGIFFKYSG